MYNIPSLKTPLHFIFNLAKPKFIILMIKPTYPYYEISF